MNLMTIVYFLGALLIFGIIVVAHEFGHFISARLVGIPVLEFSVGFGPTFFGWQRGGTQYSLRAIPLGGYCKYMGEDDGDYDSPGALNNQKPWKRFVTVASGPVMNFVLAYVVVILMLALYGYPVSVPSVASVEAGTPAAQAGLMEGDIVTDIDGEALPYAPEGAGRMRELIQSADRDAGITLNIKRGEQALQMRIVPELNADGGYLIGITMGQAIRHANLVEALSMSWPYIKYYSTVMVVGLKNLVFKGEGLEGTMGPVGMISVVTQEIQRGWDTAFFLILIISLNLGIMNLLPLPALDGGRLVFIALEGIRRKPIKPELEGMVHAIGFLLLIGLMLFITYNDIVRLVTGGGA